MSHFPHPLASVVLGLLTMDPVVRLQERGVGVLEKLLKVSLEPGSSLRSGPSYRG